MEKPGSAKIRQCTLLSLATLLIAFQDVTASPAVQTQTAHRSSAISGRVVSEEGSNVEGAWVSCFSLDGSSQASRSTLSDADGQFTVAGLKPGPYRVSAYIPGYVAAQNTAGRIVRTGESVTMVMIKGGVITGTVTDTVGAPVVGVLVSAFRTRDSDGSLLRGDPFGRSRTTDDRGVYRIHGLEEGTYVVAVNPISGAVMNAYDLDVPTYHPSSNRDGASQVTVHAGSEMSGIDIRHRKIRGHAISGIVEGVPESSPGFGFLVEMVTTGAGAAGSWTISWGTGSSRTFQIDGVPDGEYEIAAHGNISREETATTSPKKVTVRGADVSGIRLVAIPLGRIAGKATLETEPGLQSKTCPSERHSWALNDVYLRAVRDQKRTEPEPLDRLAIGNPISESGEFLLRNIRPAPYRLVADLPDAPWYLKAISIATTSGAGRIDLGKDPLTLKPGETVANVRLLLAAGAGNIQGKLQGDKAKSGRWRVHLIPVEAERAENTLVYYEANVAEQRFSLEHVAPGRYWLLATAVSEEEPSFSVSIRPVAWEKAERTRLRRDAEAGKIEIDVKPCVKINDYALPIQ